MIRLKTSRKEGEVVTIAKRRDPLTGVEVFPVTKVRRKPPKVASLVVGSVPYATTEVRKRVVKSRRVLVRGLR